MNTSQKSGFALCGTLFLLVGCATERESHLVTAPPPPTRSQTPAPQQVVVVTQPQQVVAVAPAGVSSYVVMAAPPAAPAPVAIPARPSSQHVWVAGYWTWQNNRYEWMAARWEVPPYAGAKWVNPRTESESGNYRFYEGYWK